MPAYRIELPRHAIRILVGAWLGAIAGLVAVFIGMNAGMLHDFRSLLVVMVVAAGVGAFAGASRPHLYRCSEVPCRAVVPRDAVVCPACGSGFARAITLREWDELQAAIGFPDCVDCRPDAPCAVHAAM